MNNKLTIVGHTVLDDKFFFYENQVKKIKNQLGGPCAYASVALSALSVETQCLTSVGKKFPQNYFELLFESKNVVFHFLSSEETTRFIHEIYPSERKMKLLSEAEKLDEFVTFFKPTEVCLISPVFREISLEGIQWMSKNYPLVVLDIQGLMRSTKSDGSIIIDYDRNILKGIIELADFTKYSKREASHFTGKNSFVEILNGLPQNNIQIVTDGMEGLYYSNNGEFFQLRTTKVEEVDPTGAGDVLMTGFLARFIETKDFEFSLSYGMALAAEKVTYSGIKPLPDKKYDEIAKKILETKVEIK